MELLEVDNIACLGCGGVQSKLFRRVLRQFLAVPLCSVHNEHFGLLIQIGKGLFKLSLATVRREVETLDASINGSSPTVNHKLSPVKQYPSRASGHLKTDHEDSVLLYRSNIFHVENRRSTFQHTSRRNNDSRGLRRLPTIIPAVNPVSHLTRPLEHSRVPQRI